MTPQSPSPLLTARIRPETEQWRPSFGFLAPNPSPASCCRTQDHPAAATSSTPPRHLTLSLTTAISNGAPETEPSRSLLWLWSQTPFPPLVLPIGRAHHNQHHHCITPPPFPTIPCCRFTRRARNRATTVRFRFFGPNPFPCLAFRERTTPPPPPPDTHYPTPSLRHPPLLLLTAHPKSSHVGSVSFFWPKPTPPARVIEWQPQPPLPPYFPYPTNHLHRSLQPFPRARTKPSPGGSVSDFRPKTHHPTRIIEWSPQPPPPPRFSHPTSHLHRLLQPFPTARARLSPGRSDSGFRLNTHLPPLASSKGCPNPIHHHHHHFVFHAPCFQLFTTALPKPSYSSSVLGFCLNVSGCAKSDPFVP